MKPTKSLDRRVRRTHRLLVEALIALALEKDYDSITIREITARADLAYSTFFRHYPDKDALVRAILEKVIAEMRDLVALPMDQAGVLIFERVRDNEALYRVLLNSMRVASIGTYVHDLVMREILRSPVIPTQSPVPREVAANHVMLAIMGLIEWWLTHNMPYTPERMGIVYSELIIKPVLALRR
jgi:AcrR family transcriptional regulator